MAVAPAIWYFVQHMASMVMGAGANFTERATRYTLRQFVALLSGGIQLTMLVSLGAHFRALSGGVGWGGYPVFPFTIRHDAVVDATAN